MHRTDEYLYLLKYRMVEFGLTDRFLLKFNGPFKKLNCKNFLRNILSQLLLKRIDSPPPSLFLSRFLLLFKSAAVSHDREIIADIKRLYLV